MAANTMRPLHYSLVAYVRNQLGGFVEQLRAEVCPEQAHLPAHVTVLPPRLLRGSEEDSISLVESVCREVEPFPIELGEIETFLPTTPTIFLRVAHAAYRMRELHERLNAGPLRAEEQWPYMPHLTIAKLGSNERAKEVLEHVQRSWADFGGSRRVLIDQLTFVRESRQPGRWEDLAPFPLGRQLATTLR